MRKRSNPNTFSFYPEIKKIIKGRQTAWIITGIKNNANGSHRTFDKRGAVSFRSRVRNNAGLKGETAGE